MNIHYDRNASASKQTSMEHVRLGGWHFQVEKDLGADFKLNDHFHSRYARTIMKQYPELEGFFELRELRAERHASEH